MINTSSPHDLVIFVDRAFAGFLRSDGTDCRPLTRIPLSSHQSGMFAGILARLVRENKPRRVLLTVSGGVPYAGTVDPILTTLEGCCEAARVPLIWLPDPARILKAMREFSRARIPRPEHSAPDHAAS